MSTEDKRNIGGGGGGEIPNWNKPSGKAAVPGRLSAFVWTCWKLNLAGAMEFRMSFLLLAGMMMVNNAVWLFFWGLFFNRFPSVSGWGIHDVMMMWAVGSAGFGLSATLFGNVYRLSSLVATGQLDIYLAQPKPVLLHVLVSRMSVSAIGDFMFGVIIYAAFGPRSVIGIVKFALAIVLAMLIFVFFTLAAHTLAFYFGNAEGISFQLFNALLTFSLYPTDIFRGWGRIVLFTAIPAGFISYMPVGLMRTSVELPFLLGVTGVALLLCLGGTWFFYKGLKRYSSGNMMTMRM